MRLIVLRSSRAAAQAVAGFLAGAIRRQPEIVLGLATGRTMEPLYAALVDAYRRGRVDLRRVTTFNLDEFAGLSDGAPGSYREFMSRHFFDRVNIGAASTHFPGERGQPPEQYDDRIAESGGLDICLVGVGTNGHLGFNEPAGTLTARTHRVRLLPSTRRANAHLFKGRATAVPTHAVSMGIATILNARLVVLLATGSSKARMVARALRGPVTTRVPASLLQVHPHVVVVMDRAAASHLGRPRRRRSRRLR